MSDKTSHTKEKDLHENSDYPMHSPNKGTVEPTSGGFIKRLLKKIFG